MNMGRLEIYEKVKIWINKVRDIKNWSDLNADVEKVYFFNQIVDEAKDKKNFEKEDSSLELLEKD